jgi:hypothetical protein
VSSGGGGYGTIQVTNIAGTNTITGDTVPEIDEYVQYQIYLLKPFAANTGPVTVNLNEIGALDLLTPSGVALSAGDLSPNIEYLIKHNGTEFRLLSTF